MRVMLYLSTIILGYFCGAFPTGYVIAKLWRGVDVRKFGSGRTGGTNVLRAAGVGPAIVTVVGDTLKGYVAVVLAQALLGTPLAGALAGVAAILGHNYSVFLGWKGGAGSMTNIGALFALSPVAALVVAVGGLIPLIVLRFASLGSVVAATLTTLSLLVGAILGQIPAQYVIYGMLSSSITLYELRKNIERLRTGTERKIG
jgi:glycerol-3-phosphate acyltransferase PlsY